MITPAIYNFKFIYKHATILQLARYYTTYYSTLPQRRKQVQNFNHIVLRIILLFSLQQTREFLPKIIFATWRKLYIASPIL